MRRFLLLLVLFPTACATPAPPQKLGTLRSPGLVGLPPPSVVAAERLTLIRDRQGLGHLLVAPAPEVRAAAALGLGRAQAPGDRGLLAPLLRDPAPEVRDAAAIALGLLGLAWDAPDATARAELSTALAAAAVEEQAVQPLTSIAWALGRAGGPASGAALGTLLGHPDPQVRAEAGLSLGYLARFHAPADRQARAKQAAALVRDRDPQARAGAAFALLYLEDPAQAAAVAALARDGDPTVRAFAARALGAVALEPSLLEALTGDPDFRVRVEAVRGLQAAVNRLLSPPPPPPGVLPPGSAPAPEVVGAVAARPFVEALVRAASALARGAVKGGPLAAQPLELLLRPVAGATPEAAARAALGTLATAATPTPQLGADLGRLHCLAAAAVDRAAGSVVELPGCGGGAVPKEVVERREAMVLGELAARPGAAPELASRLELLATSGAPAVRMEALGALGKLPAGQAQGALLAALTDRDPGVLSAAAEAAGAAKLSAARGPLLLALPRVAGAGEAEAAQAILTALGELPPEPASSAALRAALGDPRNAVRTSARAAYAKVTSEEMAATAAASFPPIPPRLPAAPDLADPARTLRLVTEKGTIRARLDFDRAPIASENLRALARKRFFDGTVFHRLEPGFVVQGGDPRGDGSGGPGHAIPCENFRAPYLRGTLGMALSGKDTGGSQFFFTFGRTPHLEGRYTAFGQVVSGMEVADRLLAGDRILEATVE